MQILLALVAMVLVLPSAARADPPDEPLGVAVTSEYVSSNIRCSNGVAVQPHVALRFDGAGGCASGVDGDWTGADMVCGLSLGCGAGAGPFLTDLGPA
jgi:hypothetical protein